MEIVAFLVFVAILVAVIRSAGRPTGAAPPGTDQRPDRAAPPQDAATRQGGGSTEGPRPALPPQLPAAYESALRREERLADEAFVDGLLIGAWWYGDHFHPTAEDHEEPDPWLTETGLEDDPDEDPGDDADW